MSAASEPPWDPDYDGPTPITRLPSHDNPAEQALLGALILKPTLAETTHGELDPGDFWKPIHETIWDAIHHIAQDPTRRLDPLTLAAELTTRGQLTTLPGGALYIHELITACPIPDNAPAYARTIRDHARIRAVDHLGTKLTAAAASRDIDRVNTILENAVDALDDAVNRFGPRTNTGATTGLADLTWLLHGDPPAHEPPTYTRRTDGHALFYAGKVNGIFGDPEAAKTWIAQTAIVEALNAGGTAAFVDVDHNGQEATAVRLLLLGARREHLADPDRFRYYEPEETNTLTAAITDITNRRPDVVVIDSLGEILPMLGVKSVDNDEITAALRLICQPPANAGSCVITIDHLPKSTEARTSGYAIGGTAKKRVMRGSYIRAEARTQPTPGQIGRVTLRIEKDTTGELRKNTPGGYAGTFILDSTNYPHAASWRVTLDDSPLDAAGEFRPTQLMEAVSRYVEDHDACSKNEIETGVKGSAKNIRAAIEILEREGFINRFKTGGRGGGYRYSAAAIYRADNDHTPADPIQPVLPEDPWTVA